MSQENVEVIRRAFEAWNAGDMDTFRELCDPGVIWRVRKVGRSRGRTRVGRRSCARWTSCARPGTATALS